MSVIMRNLAGNSGGGSSKGFPPGDVTNVIVITGIDCVLLKWKDPDDTIEGTTALSTWYSTIVVRKEGSIPTSIKDGTVVLENTERNKYKDITYEDNNVEVGHTYYYRFYTMSTDKVYNDSTNMIYSITVNYIDTTLKNNSWDNIRKISNAGKASQYWKIGDEIHVQMTKDIELSKSATIKKQVLIFQIWDFNHFDKSDGSGKAGICFGMKNLLYYNCEITPSNLSYGGWNSTYTRNILIPKIIDTFPVELQNMMEEVITYANIGFGDDNNSKEFIGLMSKDKLFIPGYNEVFGTGSGGFGAYQSKTESGQIQFPIFTNNNSRIKKVPNGSAEDWWTRSPYYNSQDFIYVGSNGDEGRTKYGWSYNNYFCFCFNV